MVLMLKWYEALQKLMLSANDNRANVLGPGEPLTTLFTNSTLEQ